MKKIFAVISIFLIIIISGCIDNTQYEDCGTAILTSMDISYSQSALVCMGENLLNNCQKSRVVLDTASIGKINFIAKGPSSEICMMRLEYGDEEQILEEDQKKFANKYIECPINLERVREVFSQPEISIDDPGYFAVSAYTAVVVSSWSLDSSCTGTVMDVIRSESNI